MPLLLWGLHIYRASVSYYMVRSAMTGMGSGVGRMVHGKYSRPLNRTTLSLVNTDKTK